MKLRVDQRRAAFGVLSGMWIVAACGGTGAGGGSEAWSGTVRDSAGVQVVENPVDGMWGESDAWTISEVLRIGSTGGDPDYEFARISGIAELADGRIAVFDAQAQHMRFFASDGIYERTVGGPGSGPGEFSVGAGPILVGLGDTLVVPDAANQRANRLDPAGEPLGSFRLDFTTAVPLAWMDRPDGAIVSQMRPLNLPGTEPREPEDVLVLRQMDGTVTDTLLVIESGETITFKDGAPVLKFFSPEPIWSLFRNGVMSGVSDDYRFFVYGADGTLERIITRPFEPRPVSDEDRQLLIDAMMTLYEDYGVAGPALDIVRQGMSFGDTYPVYALLREGPGSSIWVQRLRVLTEMSAEELEGFNPELGFGSPEWDVFDPEGRYLGIVRMPDRFTPIRFQGDRIYGIRRDELDVQYALILQVEGAE